MMWFSLVPIQYRITHRSIQTAHINFSSKTVWLSSLVTEEELLKQVKICFHIQITIFGFLVHHSLSLWTNKTLSHTLLRISWWYILYDENMHYIYIIYYVNYQPAFLPDLCCPCMLYLLKSSFVQAKYNWIID